MILGTSTAQIGYEWTSLVQGDNMHRVVIYRDGGDKAGQMVPYTTMAPRGSFDPRDLWKWLTSYEEHTAGDVLAIAHNGNLSNGIMFAMDAQWNGTPLDNSYLTQRATWEPLYEASHFGKGMAASIFDLDPGASWQGPFESSYGFHLVLMSRRKDGRYPTLDEIRVRVTEDARQARIRAKTDEATQEIVDRKL